MIMTNKNILMVMGPFSGKAWGAGQQDSYNLIKLLKELGYDIFLVSYDYFTNYDFVKKFEETGARVFVISLKNKFSFYSDPATAPFYKLCENKEFQKIFNDIGPEIAIGAQTFTFPVLEFAKKKGASTIFRSHNLEDRHHMDMLRGWQFLNPLNYFFYISKFFSERRAAKNSSFVLAISPMELAIYRKWNPNSKLLPLCSLHDIIKNPAERLSQTHDYVNIFYAGASYNIIPHLKGAELLIKKIMPRLGGKFRLHIIGSKLPQELIDRCDGKKIIYRGYVEDYEKTLEEMDVGVFPVFTGKGMKQKIFEAICRGFPVVAPEKSLGGYPFDNGKNIFFAANCGEFVKNIFKLENKKEREKMSCAAYEFAQKNFNKNVYIRILQESLP